MEYQIAHALRERGQQAWLLSLRDDLEHMVRHLSGSPDLVFKKILASFGVSVPGFVSYRLHEEVTSPPALGFPLIVKPLQADASAGISQASVVQDVDALADRVSFILQRLARRHCRGVRRWPGALREHHWE